MSAVLKNKMLLLNGTKTFGPAERSKWQVSRLIYLYLSDARCKKGISDAWVSNGKEIR